MKLGVMSEVDETFTTIWLSRSSKVRVKVRRWPQSLLGLFLCMLPVAWLGPPLMALRYVVYFRF